MQLFDVLSPSDKIDAKNELCFASRSESIDFHLINTAMERVKV